MRIVIHGLGRLGLAIAELATEQKLDVVAGIDIKKKDAKNFEVFENFENCPKADVIVDSSHADAIPQLLENAQGLNIPLVICTTGLSQDTLAQIQKTAETLPIFLSSNMSLGVNLVSKLAQTATKALDGANFDIEIIEAHHNQKLDAPSGTGLLLAQSINAAADGKYKFVFDRSHALQKRCPDEIGISAIRGGTIVGEHTIIFAGPDEVIEITHKAASREIFARGALKAAQFIAEKKPGLYTMDDLLN
ncbi:MAG: 4-hydroxy-tetrahydrodipicolinate reductase [Defluviitaleaceae bacterium]|nr:4-hydroxy-tetrahydrodipicolinate reductase [Defluviitaleaceae bacterium]